MKDFPSPRIQHRYFWLIPVDKNILPNGYEFVNFLASMKPFLVRCLEELLLPKYLSGFVKNFQSSFANI